jgi:hypothetical protein
MNGDKKPPISSEEIGSVGTAARSIVGYELPIQNTRVFSQFHNYITADPKPPFVLEADADPDAARWLKLLREGVLEATKNALACVYYHHNRIAEMESHVTSVLYATGIVERLQACNAAIVPLNTVAIDAEYQAFILASRRSLDYFTRALAAFFRAHFHSFRKFGNFLSDREPLLISNALKAEHQNYVDKFSRSLLSNSTTKSTRDLITHYEYLSAGCLNVGPLGIFFLGGGEQIGHSALVEGKTLTKILAEHKDLLQACIDNLLRTFTVFCRRYYRQKDLPLRDSNA